MYVPQIGANFFRFIPRNLTPALTILTCIRTSPRSNLDRDSYCHDRGFTCFFFLILWQMSLWQLVLNQTPSFCVLPVHNSQPFSHPTLYSLSDYQLWKWTSNKNFFIFLFYFFFTYSFISRIPSTSLVSRFNSVDCYECSYFKYAVILYIHLTLVFTLCKHRG